MDLRSTLRSLSARCMDRMEKCTGGGIQHRWLCFRMHGHCCSSHVGMPLQSVCEQDQDLQTMGCA